MSTRWPPRITSPSSGGGGGVVTLSGDVTGPSNANTVEAIQNNPVSAAAPSLGDVLVWDGAQWVPQAQSPGPTIISPPGRWNVAVGVSVGNLVYATAAAFTAAQADNSGLATAPGMGIVIAKPTPTTATVAYVGEVSVFAGLVPGSLYYLGTSGGIILGGALPGTPGSVVQRVGVAADANTLILNPILVDVVV